MKIKIKRYETEQGPLYGLVVSKETLATLTAAFGLTSCEGRDRWLVENYRGYALSEIDANAAHNDYCEMYQFLYDDLKK